MPAAKKPATKKTSARSAVRSVVSSAPKGPITRKEVEAATAKFDKALSDASTALSMMRTHLGRNVQSAYKDVAAGLRTLQRDAARTNKTLLKDLDKLRTAVAASGGTASRSDGSSSSRSTASKRRPAKRSAAKRTTAKGGSRSASKASASKASASKASARKAPTRAAKSSSAKTTRSTGSSTASRSRSATRKSS